jgi:hypothetical protein
MHYYDSNPTYKALRYLWNANPYGLVYKPSIDLSKLLLNILRPRYINV